MHRDIKPENLIFDSKGFLHITDFGISRKFQNLPLTELSGTPCYMAPEILMKTGHSYSVDIYAMGIIMYEFMTGKRPYKGRTRKEVDIIIPVMKRSKSRSCRNKPKSKGTC